MTTVSKQVAKAVEIASCEQAFLQARPVAVTLSAHESSLSRLIMAALPSHILFAPILIAGITTLGGFAVTKLSWDEVSRGSF
ncbi:hypothetical protein [Caulobacter mirabilis]|uniref:hypothetical protein n=1 Tax=Caulobacter mirabilis TaxID=69666 RepID=UPI0015596901|nr:hypothetical protein [Caulobacter mirabilis]